MVQNRNHTEGSLESELLNFVSPRMFIIQTPASQLHILANRNAALSILPIFWPVNCIKIRGHVALLSGSTLFILYTVTRVGKAS